MIFISKMIQRLAKRTWKSIFEEKETKAIDLQDFFWSKFDPSLIALDSNFLEILELTTSCFDVDIWYNRYFCLSNRLILNVFIFYFHMLIADKLRFYKVWWIQLNKRSRTWNKHISLIQRIEVIYDVRFLDFRKDDIDNTKVLIFQFFTT